MESTQSPTTTQMDFKLQVSMIGSHLSLRGHNLQNDMEFDLELEGFDIARTTKNTVSDTQSISQNLQEAADNTSSGIDFSLDHQGSTYSAKISPENFSFSMNLKQEEVSVDPAISLQRKANALGNELEKVKLHYQEEMANMRREYEKKIARMEQMVLQEQEKNVKMQAEYEVKLSRVSQKRPPVPTFDQFAPKQIRFRKDTPSAGNFEFSDNDKTAKLVQWVEWKGKRTLKCYPKVPGTGKHTFSLEVNQIQQFIGFGITTKEEGEVYHGDQRSYFYYIKHGMLSKRVIKQKIKFMEQEIRIVLLR